MAVVLAALAVAPVTGSTAQTSGGASVQSQGWWNAGAQPLDAPRATPLGGVAPPVTLPTPDVPEGSVPVAMRVGQPSRIGAIGIVLDAPKGSVANSVVLRLKEAAAGQQGSSPAVRACPITTFLVPEQGGPSANIPEADCDAASADGERADDGTWTFDLTSIAAVWLDPNGVIQASGVRLDPVGEPPATFQVAFTGIADAVLDADVTPGSDAAGDAFSTGGSFDSGSSSGGGSFDSGSSFGGGSVDSSFGGGSSDFAAPSAEVPEVPTAAAAPTATSAPSRTLPVANASRAGKTFGNWPLSVVLLLAAALALALAMGVTLGPAGRERPDLGRRQGGVSRALGSRFSTTSTRRA